MWLDGYIIFVYLAIYNNENLLYLIGSKFSQILNKPLKIAKDLKIHQSCEISTNMVTLSSQLRGPKLSSLVWASLERERGSITNGVEKKSSETGFLAYCFCEQMQKKLNKISYEWKAADLSLPFVFFWSEMSATLVRVNWILLEQVKKRKTF